MLARTCNLIFASGAFLIFIGAMSGASWAGSPSPPPKPPHLSAWGLTMLLIELFIVLAWFAGAIGLFFHKRLAWLGSLIGVGSSVCFFAAFLVTIIGLYLFPDAEMDHLNVISGGHYKFALIFGITQFSLLLAGSVGLFVGLVRKRKELLTHPNAVGGAPTAAREGAHAPRNQL